MIDCGVTFTNPLIPPMKSSFRSPAILGWVSSLALIVLFSGCSQSKKSANQSGEQPVQSVDQKLAAKNPETETSENTKPAQVESDQATEPTTKTGSVADKQIPPPEAKSEDREKLAAKKLAQLNAEFDLAVEKLTAAIEQLSTNEEKQQLFDSQNPEPAYTRNLLALAKEYPETDSAFSAAMNIVLERQTSAEFANTMDFVLEHHAARVQWHRIAEGYLELVPSQQIEGWMRKMIETAEIEEVKVKMTFLLYRYFDQFPTFASTIEYNPAIKKRFPQEQINYIYNRKNNVREELLAELKELQEKYPDVKALNNQTVKDVIEGPIFELEHLQVGSAAPDIEGVDFDGIEFKLSDYRGKVVMLGFWGYWCPPCRAMFPHERELIEQLVGMPFVLIGVNSDRRLETAVKATKEENLVWRNFWCGPKGRAGPIAKKWNVSAWPTVYLIDANGVIRYKEVLGREIDTGIEALLAEMGHQVSIASKLKNTKSKLALNSSQTQLDNR